MENLRPAVQKITGLVLRIPQFSRWVQCCETARAAGPPDSQELCPPLCLSDSWWWWWWWPNEVRGLAREVTEPEDPDDQLIKNRFSQPRAVKKLAAANVNTTRAGSRYRTDLCIVTIGISRWRRKDLGLSVRSVSFVLTGGHKNKKELLFYCFPSFFPAEHPSTRAYLEKSFQTIV